MPHFQICLIEYFSSKDTTFQFSENTAGFEEPANKTEPTVATLELPLMRMMAPLEEDGGTNKPRAQVSLSLLHAHPHTHTVYLPNSHTLSLTHTHTPSSFNMNGHAKERELIGGKKYHNNNNDSSSNPSFSIVLKVRLLSFLMSGN